MMRLSHLVRRCGNRILLGGGGVRHCVARPPLCVMASHRGFATAKVPLGEGSKDATPDEGKFTRQTQLWENYVEKGEGATELFESFLPDGQASTISAQTFQEFLQEIDHQGIGDDEFGELAGKEEFGLKDFRSWIRHATHDWTVHV